MRKSVLCFLAVLVLLISGCNSGSKPISITISSPSGAQLLDLGQSFTISVTVNNDKMAKGATFMLSGVGTLSNQSASGATYTAPATGAGGSATITIASATDPTKTTTIMVTVTAPPSLSGVASTLTGGIQGATYTASVAATGGAGALTYTVTVGSLPAGLSINSSTGAITGTPTGTGTFTFTVQVKDSSTVSPQSSTKTFTITVNQQPTITSNATTTFVAGTAGTFQVNVTSIPNSAITESGALPAGVTFTDNGNNTATLAGTTSATGTYPITINANNGIGTAATQNFSLIVAKAPAITSAASVTFTAGAAATPFSVTTTGYPAPTLAESGALPSGITFTDNKNGTATITGTPAANSGGKYTFTITASNGTLPNATQSFTLTVNQAPAVSSANSATFNINVAATPFSVTTTGYPAPALSETGSLPAGVSFVDNHNGTATISGTPTAPGAFPITITANNGVSPNGTQSFTLSVDQPPAITSGNSLSATAGGTAPPPFTVTSTGYPTPTISETGALPTGVTFTGGTGTGTITVNTATATGGKFTFTINASNGVNPNATQTFTVTINQAPAISSASAATFSVNAAGSFTVTTSASTYPVAALSESGSLPSGVAFVDQGNGTAKISGTATAAGSFPITITASNGILPNATQSFTLTVNTAPAFTSPNKTTFTVGSAGTFNVTATGTPTPSFSESGALPSGVSFVDNHDGSATLSGTPAAGTGGTYTLTITATNSAGSNIQTFTLTVDQAPTITTVGSTTFTVGAFASFTVKTTGVPKAALSESGALPSGVSFVDNGDGTATLSGTPAPGTANTYTFTITANNGITPNATQSFTLTVNTAPVFSSGASTTFTVGQTQNFSVAASGSPTFTETGALPPGVTFTDNGNGTATLGGTPAAHSGNVYNFTIKATNATGSTSQPFTLTVDEAPYFNSQNTATFAIGQASNFNVSAGGYPIPTLSDSGATLPSGVTFTAATGALAGTPATGTAGTYPITFTAANGIGSNATQNFTLTVVTDPCVGAGTGGEALLNGQYVFVLKGFDNESPTQEPALVGGVLKFNGSGGITSGTIDTNLNAGFDTLNGGNPLSVTSGTYKIGTSGSADQQRVCMDVVTTTAGTLHYRASLNGAGSLGHMIGFDNSGPYVAGELKKQTSIPANLSGGFAFGVSSAANTASCDTSGVIKVCGGKFGAVGQFVFSSAGTVTGGAVDFNHGDGSTAFINQAIATNFGSPVSISSGGTYSINGTTGRGLLTFNPGGPGNTANAVIYAVSSTDLLIMGSDPAASSTAFAGEMLQQTAASPSGIYVGATSRLGSISGDSRAQLIRATLSGGNITALTIYQNDSGTTTVQSASNAGTYTFDSTTGRIVLTVTGSNHNSVLYGVNANQAFELNASPAVESGFLQTQTSTAAPNGNYAFGTIDPATSNVSEQDGIAVLSSGNVTVTQDRNTLNQQQAGQVQSPQSFSVDGTGLGTVPSGCAPATPGSCQFLFYVISSTNAVGIDFDSTSQTPAVQPLDH